MPSSGITHPHGATEEKLPCKLYTIRTLVNESATLPLTRDVSTRLESVFWQMHAVLCAEHLTSLIRCDFLLVQTFIHFADELA